MDNHNLDLGVYVVERDAWVEEGDDAEDEEEYHDFVLIKFDP